MFLHFEMELTQPDAVWKETCWYATFVTRISSMVLMMY